MSKTALTVSVVLALSLTIPRLASGGNAPESRLEQRWADPSTEATRRQVYGRHHTTGGQGWRWKTSGTDDDQPALAVRFRYTGTAGLTFGGSLFDQDDATEHDGDDWSSTLLAEAHAVWRHGPFGARARLDLWCRDDTAGENADPGVWAGYRLVAWLEATTRIGLSARHDGQPVNNGIHTIRRYVGIDWRLRDDLIIEIGLWRQSAAGGLVLSIDYRF